MRKFYSVFMTVLLSSLFITLDAAECSITLNIDDASSLSATLKGEPVALVSGVNTITFEGDGYVLQSKLAISSTDENVIIDRVVSETEGVNARPVQRGVLWEMWLMEENDGNEFSVYTKDMAPHRTASCTINVLDMGVGIEASRGGHGFTLHEGMNTVAFDPGTETGFTFNLLTWVSCHTFTINGNEVEKSFYTYDVSLADGDEVVIAVYDPVNVVPVHISVTPGAEAVLTTVEVNYNTLEDWSDFTMKKGEKLGIMCDTGNYNIKSFMLNGEEIGYPGYFSMIADTEPIDIAIDAALWGDLKFTVNINEPKAVKMYYIEDIINEDGDPDTSESERFDLVAGENMLSMPERKARLVIVPRYGYASTITYADGSPVEIDDNTVTNPYQGMVINIDAAELAYDSAYAVFVDGEYGHNDAPSPSMEPTCDFDFGCYAHAWSEDWTDIEHGGYTVIPTISQHEIEWAIAVEGCRVGKMEVYYNDSRMTDKIEAMTWGDWFESRYMPQDGDVWRFYPKGTPDRYDVIFKIAPEAAGTEVIADYVKPLADLSVYSAFEGQQFVVRAPDGMIAALDGKPLDPREDGTVVFTAMDDCTLSVSELSGIESVMAPDEAPLPVYNMQGIRMEGNLDTLPAGIYVTGGRKVVIK